MATIDLYDDLEAIYDQGTDLVGLYRKDPVIAALDLLRVDLAPVQRIVLRDMWFKNYCITVAGRGCGKSASTDSLSYIKDKGLCYLYEEFPTIPTFLKNEETIEIEDDAFIYTSDGFFPTKRISLEKNIDGLKLKTNKGFIHKGSKYHPLLTLDSDCNFIYKPLQDIKPGDRVCIQRGQNVFGKEHVNGLDAYLIGLFIGDGLIGKKYNHQDITTCDEEIKDYCISYCKQFDIPYRVDKDKRTTSTVSVVFKQFSEFFDKYNIKRCESYYKEIPSIIRQSDKQTQVNFLQGLFDTDGGFEFNRGVVSFCSVSKKLVKEVQLMLLNFGIVSSLREKKTKSAFGRAFILSFGSNDLIKFRNEINFRLSCKQNMLDEYLFHKKLNTNIDTIPYVKDLCYKISRQYRLDNSTSYNSRWLPSLKVFLSNSKEYTYKKLVDFVIKALNLIVDGYKFSKESIADLEKLYNIITYNYFFDVVKSVSEWQGDCYDFEMDMETEPNYFANGFINHNTYLLGVNAVLHALLYPGYRVGLIGPSFRQSKMIFAEVEKLYNRSPILRQATAKKPTRGADTCFLAFKSTENTNGSYIEALPIGVDGAKIRGSRFYLIEIDELAQMPPDVIDLVIRPMAAVHAEPMQKVREIERIQKLIELGLATEDDLEDSAANKMIMASSGYYKFNHMWHRMKAYWQELKRGEEQYAVHQIPYTMMPRGFLDMNNISEAQRTMSSVQFMMEYEAAMASDSEGFFKASLLEACTRDSGFSVQLQGYADREYVLGIDPNQGGAALFGLTMIELGSPSKIVYVRGLKKLTTQEMTEQIQRLSNTFNIKRIYMDAQGGGNAIKDLLAEGYNGSIPILDMDDDKNIYKAGRRILKLVNFSPAWISDANFATLALLEHNRLRFPELPRSSDEAEERMYEDVRLLKAQMLNIVVTETARGIRHFDTPKKGQNKDLYSAIILAAYGVKELAQDDYAEPVLQAAGLVRPHQEGSQFTGRSTPSSARDTLASAVLRPQV